MAAAASAGLDPVSQAIGTGIGALQGIFGTATDQNVGGTTQSRLSLDPAQAAELQRLSGDLTGQIQGQGGLLDFLKSQSQQAQAGVPSLQTGFSQFAPQLGGVQAPKFSQTPDALAQSQTAQGQQALQNQTAAQQRNIAQQFAGQGGAASQILQAQAAQRSALQANPLAAQAAQGQAVRELGQQGLIQSGQIAQGQQQLAGAGFQAQLQQLANASQLGQQQAGAAGRGEAQNALLQGINASQGNLGSQAQIAKLFGRQITENEKESKGRSGGLFGLL